MRRSLKASLLVGDYYIGDVASTLPKYEQLKSAVFLHGILGNRKNWRTPAKLFLREKPEFVAVSVDHRAHGHSNLVYPITKTKNSVKDCALDLMKFLSSEEYLNNTNSFTPDPVPHTIVSHSFGGKVALEYLRLCLESDNPSNIPKNIWILDTIPGLYERKSSFLNMKVNKDSFHEYEKKMETIINDNNNENTRKKFSSESALDILYCVKNAPREYNTKKEAINYLYDQGVPKPVADWISTNLIDSSEESYTNSSSLSKLPVTYSFNIDVIMEMFNDFIHLDYFPLLENYNNIIKDKNINEPCHIHIVRAEKNNAWTEDILNLMNNIENNTNGLVKFYTMPNVGHWLHSENPRGTIDMIVKNSYDMEF